MALKTYFKAITPTCQCRYLDLDSNYVKIILIFVALCMSSLNYNQNGRDFLFLKSNYSYRTTLSLIYYYINTKITFREKTE
jgi:hypothetical protein